MREHKKREQRVAQWRRLLSLLLPLRLLLALVNHHDVVITISSADRVCLRQKNGSFDYEQQPPFL